MKKGILRFSVALGIATLVLVGCKKKKDDNNNPPTPTSGTFTDTRDNKSYNWITISGQTWMAENLKYAGTLSAGTSSCYSGSEDSCTKYGRLYTGDAAKVACPSGWHLPSDAEWRLFEHNLGMSDADTAVLGASNPRGVPQAIGIKLQKGGSTGFNVLLQADQAEFWTSSASSMASGSQIYRRFVLKDSSIYRSFYGGSNVPLCVRCLKN